MRLGECHDLEPFPSRHTSPIRRTWENRCRLVQLRCLVTETARGIVIAISNEAVRQGGDLRVARRRRQIIVPEQDLDDPDISSVLQKMGGEAVA
jgi:hypothetical protein